jgi:hypothetical protein
MAGRTLIIPIYYLILIACIGVSSNFSFRGFYETFPTEIYVVVFILALGLFAAGLMLQLGRDQKSLSKQLLALLIFMIFATFSTSSNMNYIYTKMKWEDVRKEAFREEYQKYVKSLEIIEKDLIDQLVSDQEYFEKIATAYYTLIDEEISKLKSDIVTSKYYQNQRAVVDKLQFELAQMRIQALDPGAPGCGTKCRAHMATIDELIPTTETTITSSKKAETIKRFWVNYHDKKMRAFCGATFTNYHSLRSLIEQPPGSDFCVNDSSEYIKQYPPNQLEVMRTRIQRSQNYDENALLKYISSISNEASRLEAIKAQIGAIDASFSLESKGQKITLPRSITEAAEFLSENGVGLPPINIAEIKLRESLIADLGNSEFLTGTVSSVSMELDEVFIFDKDLTQNDVVKSIDVPLRPFLEVVASKQKIIIDRYAEVSLESRLEELESLKVDPANGQIGEVQYTVPYAIKEFSQTTVISFLLGFAFDIIPIIFAFAAFHGYKPEEPEYDPIIG